MSKLEENRGIIERMLKENEEDLDTLYSWTQKFKIVSKRISDRAEVIMLLVEENIKIRTLQFNQPNDESKQ